MIQSSKQTDACAFQKKKARVKFYYFGRIHFFVNRTDGFSKPRATWICSGSCKLVSWRRNILSVYLGNKKCTSNDADSKNRWNIVEWLGVQCSTWVISGRVLVRSHSFARLETCGEIFSHTFSWYSSTHLTSSGVRSVTSMSLAWKSIILDAWKLSYSCTHAREFCTAKAASKKIWKVQKEWQIRRHSLATGKRW